MGACCGTTIDANTKYINERLRQHDTNEQRRKKLLLLGTGHSGKSTIFKQLQLLYGGGFGTKDALELKQHVYWQITSQMKSAILYYLSNPSYQDILDINKTTNNNTNNENPLLSTYDLQTLSTAISIVQNHDDVTVFNNELAYSIKYIWQHEKKIQNIFQNMYTETYEINKILEESTEYFWDEIDRIKKDNYLPNRTDILNVRYRTTGVIEKIFEIHNEKFHLFDVGGAKSERKKWIKCFNDVYAVIFVVSLSCFNEIMYEDEDKNQMIDSLELFDKICNNKYFIDTTIFLLFSHMDIFEHKIKNISLTECEAFDDYCDCFLCKHNNNDINNICHSNVVSLFCETYNRMIPIDIKNLIKVFYGVGMELNYIKYKFESLNQNSDRQIVTHFINSLNEIEVEQVFNDIIDVMIE